MRLCVSPVGGVLCFLQPHGVPAWNPCELSQPGSSGARPSCAGSRGPLPEHPSSLLLRGKPLVLRCLPFVDSHAWGGGFLLWRGWSLTPWLVSCCVFIPHYGGFVQPVSGLFRGNCSTCSCVFILSLGGGELRISSYTLNRTPAPHRKFNWLFISVEEKVNSVVVQACPHIYI